MLKMHERVKSGAYRTQNIFLPILVKYKKQQQQQLLNNDFNITLQF